MNGEVTGADRKSWLDQRSTSDQVDVSGSPAGDNSVVSVGSVLRFEIRCLRTLRLLVPAYFTSPQSGPRYFPLMVMLRLIVWVPLVVAIFIAPLKALPPESDSTLI